MNIYSFTESPIENAMLHLVRLFPGIEKVVSLSYFPNLNSVKALFLNHSSIKAEEMDISNTINSIDDFRTKNNYYKWVKKTDLPFEIKQSRKNIQMEVFEELDAALLVLAFQNDIDEKSDILVVYFNHNHSNFGLSDSKSLLTPENKKIIGFILHHSISSILTIAKNDLSVLRKMNENTQLLLKKYQQTKEELTKTKNSFTNGIVDLCKSYLNELGIKFPKYKYAFSEEAIHKIRNYKGDFIQLKDIIENAVIFANNLYFESTNQIIVLNEEYFNFEQEILPDAKPLNEVVTTDRYSKTIQLLDKLENAARDVLSRNLELTGSNVGNACPIPISAPAISDALKKHRNKIIYLTEKYSNKWTTIRNEFRPFKNILAPKNDIFEKSA